jgi:hypothetical protein
MKHSGTANAVRPGPEVPTEEERAEAAPTKVYRHKRYAGIGLIFGRGQFPH